MSSSYTLMNTNSILYSAHPTGSSEDIRVVRVVVAFTGDLNPAKLVFRVQLSLTLPLQEQYMIHEKDRER